MLTNEISKMSALLKRSSTLALLALSALVLTSCFRGQPKQKPPIHIVPDMDIQPKYYPQSYSEFFKNHSEMRMPVPGTVARDELHEDKALYTGKNSAGKLITHNPLEVNMQLLERGQKEYEIYCVPCHSQTGNGRGIMLQYNYPPAANFHDQRLVDAPDGHFFDIMTHGLRNMPSYAHQIAVKDRWAIIAYIRALQKSQNAKLSEIPKDKRDQVK